MSDDNNGGRRRISDTRFKWLCVCGLIALIFVLSTIMELAK